MDKYNSKYRSNNWQDYVNLDFPQSPVITREMVEAKSRHPRILRGKCRLQTKRLPTTLEIEERRRNAMRPL